MLRASTDSTPRRPPRCKTCGQLMKGHNRLLCETTPTRTLSDRFDSPTSQSSFSFAEEAANHDISTRSLTPTESSASIDLVERGRFSMQSSNDFRVNPIRFIPARDLITDPSFEIPSTGVFHRVNPYRNQDYTMPPIAHFDGPPTLIVGSDGEPASRMSTRQSTPEPSEESNTPNSTMTSNISSEQDNKGIRPSISGHVLTSARSKLSEAIQKFREGLRVTPSSAGNSTTPVQSARDKGKMRQRSPHSNDDFNFEPIAALYEASDDVQRHLQENEQLNTAFVPRVKQLRDISPFKNPYGFLKPPDERNAPDASKDRWIVAGASQPHVQRIAATLNRQNGVIEYLHKAYYTLYWLTMMIIACAVYDRIKSFISL